MWAVWTGRVWVEIDAEMAPTYQANGYECRQLPIEHQLGPESRDPEVLPPYVEEGIQAMYVYLAAL